MAVVDVAARPRRARVADHWMLALASLALLVPE